MYGAVGLDDLERVGGKRQLSDFQDSWRVMQRNVPGSIAKVFAFCYQVG